MFGLGGPGYNQALSAGTTAASTGAGYGTQAADASSTLMPFLQRELSAPQGFTQQQIGAQEGAAMAGSGGSTAGLTTAVTQGSGTHNSSAPSGALDSAQRIAQQGVAKTSEGIAANNANLQQEQQQDAAKGLAGEQSMDQNAQLKAMGLVAPDVEAATKAFGTGDWASQLGQLSKGINAGIGTLGSVAKFAGGFM